MRELPQARRAREAVREERKEEPKGGFRMFGMGSAPARPAATGGGAPAARSAGGGR